MQTFVTHRLVLNDTNSCSHLASRSMSENNPYETKSVHDIVHSSRASDSRDADLTDFRKTDH